jgi:hypothetical protein
MRKLGFFDNHVTWNYLVNKLVKAYNHIPCDLTNFLENNFIYVYYIFKFQRWGGGKGICVCHFYFSPKWCAKFYKVQLINDEVKFIIDSNVNMVLRIYYENTKTT